MFFNFQGTRKLPLVQTTQSRKASEKFSYFCFSFVTFLFVTVSIAKRNNNFIMEIAASGTIKSFSKADNSPEPF